MPDEIVRQDRGNVTILSVPAKLDTLLSETLAHTYMELENEGRVRVVVDCEQLEFLTSIILEILANFHQKARKNDGDLKFANVPVCIEDIFALTKLDRVFSRYSSVDEAVAAF